MQKYPTGDHLIAIAAGGGGAGCFDETPGTWNYGPVSYAGSAGLNAGNAAGFPNIHASQFSGGQGANLLRGPAGRLNDKLPEDISNQFGNGRLLDTSNLQQRTGGLSIQGGGGGGGGFCGGGAGATLLTNPKSSTGGGAGSTY